MLTIEIFNFGTRAIVDVTFARLHVEGHDIDLAPTSENQLPVVQANGIETFKFNRETPQTRSI
jgi:hypothetical protein